MILEDGTNRFELELAGYQFPEIDEGKYDANYLKIRTSLQAPQGSHRVSDPCLFTWEVGWLAMWLHNVARDVPQTTTTDGIEPSLEFEHLLTEGDAVGSS